MQLHYRKKRFFCLKCCNVGRTFRDLWYMCTEVRTSEISTYRRDQSSRRILRYDKMDMCRESIVILLLCLSNFNNFFIYVLDLSISPIQMWSWHWILLVFKRNTAESLLGKVLHPRVDNLLSWIALMEARELLHV